MTKLTRFFGQTKVILILGLLLVANLSLFSLPGLAGSRPQILAAAPEYRVPDMKGLYSPAFITDFLTAIGPEGRQAYQMMHFTTDLAFPLVYGLLIFAGFCRMLTVGKATHPTLPLVALVPVLADLAENFLMVAITAVYPQAKPGLVWVAQAFTLIKFGGISFCLVTLVTLWLRGRSNRPI
jgi:hypothetical protein